jgi:hypothetical protein
MRFPEFITLTQDPNSPTRRSEAISDAVVLGLSSDGFDAGKSNDNSARALRVAL